MAGLWCRRFFGHGFTYAAHPVSAAVALETLAIYAGRDVLGHIRQVAPVFQRELRRFADHPLVGEARSVGVVGALEVVADKAARTTFDSSLKVGLLIARGRRAWADHARDGRQSGVLPAIGDQRE